MIGVTIGRDRWSSCWSDTTLPVLCKSNVRGIQLLIVIS